MSDTTKDSGELNELHAEKGRLYARYFADRPERLASNPPETDVVVGALLDEVKQLRTRVAQLEESDKTLRADMARKDAVLATAGVQLVTKLTRSSFFRMRLFKRIGEVIVRTFNRAVK